MAKQIRKNRLELDSDLSSILEKAFSHGLSMSFSKQAKLQEVRFDIDLLKTWYMSCFVSFIYNGIPGSFTINLDLAACDALMKGSDNLRANQVSEMSELIYMLFKEQLADNGYDIHLCIPTLVMGENHSILSGVATQNMILEFRIGEGHLTVEMNLLEPARLSQRNAA